MKTYIATYENKDGVISNAIFNANNIKEAKSAALFHKRHTPEIVKSKGVKTTVKVAN